MAKGNNSHGLPAATPAALWPGAHRASRLTRTLADARAACNYAAVRDSG